MTVKCVRRAWLVLLVTAMSSAICAEISPINQVSLDESAYIKCSYPNDPEGVNDLYIDAEARTVTDYFGTISSYKVAGQYIVVERYSDDVANPTLLSSTRINRFTLAVTSISPALKLYKSTSCVKLEKSCRMCGAESKCVEGVPNFV